LIAILGVSYFLDRGPSGLLDIGNRDELDIVLLQEAAEVVATPSSDADSADDDSLARSDRAV
jgi:hypothetical protein